MTPPIKDDAPPLGGFIRQAQLVPGIIPFSPATLWRLVKTGEFPAPVKLTSNITAWRVEDINDWIAERTEGGQA